MPTIDTPAVRALPLALTALAALFTLWFQLSPIPELPVASEGGQVRTERAYGELPLAFEPNAGRAQGGADFVSRSASGTVLLDSGGATLGLGTGKRAETIGFDLLDATPVAPRALDRLPGVVNDLRGDDPKRWRTEIPTFERVRYPSVWPGIDLDYYGNQRQLEYDFRLAPGADPEQIAVRVGGAERLRLAPNGDLLIDVGAETIRQRAPIAYQPATDTAPRAPVRAAFALSDDTVRFRLGSYDRGRLVVIDPVVLAYSTYLGGGASDLAFGVSVRPSGAAYVTGRTTSTDFDTVGEIEGATGDGDVFVSKLTPAGDALVYSTYLGGSDSDHVSEIEVDSSGAAYVIGHTRSTDFDTVGEIEGDSAEDDVYVFKLNPAGNEIGYSTYLGGNRADHAGDIAVHSSGAVYVTGQTTSTDFNMVGEIQGHSGFHDAFVSKLTPAGNALVYSTYLGGENWESGGGITVDSFGAAYVTGDTRSPDFPTVDAIEGDSAGHDVFASKLTPAGNTLEYSTYLGGNRFDEGHDIAVDSAGAAYVAGTTDSPDFDTVGEIEGDSAPAPNCGFECWDDAFVFKLTPAGNALEYSTYLGGERADRVNGLAIDPDGAAYVTGVTESPDFDTVGEIEGNSGGSGIDADAFVSKLTPAGSALVYSTYLGGGSGDHAEDIAVDSSGAAYITGLTASTNFNTVDPFEGDSAGTDVFVSKLSFVPGCTITGTTGNDTLIGTAGVDSICGLGGNDTIVGKQGDDLLLGDDGRDTLIGSEGDDTLDGGPDQDRADFSNGATGGVNLNLATGVSTSANLGTDTILEDAGVSTIEQAGGTPFADTLVGDGRDNLFQGNAGNDTIEGRSGADVLFGGGGDDELAGESGPDKLEPGTGDDPMVSGGAGSDTVRYPGVGTGGVSIDLAAGTVLPLGGGTSGIDTLAADIENAIGSPGADELSAQLAGIASVLEGGDGADSLDSSDGDGLDHAKGGADADACATDAGDKRKSCP